MNFNFRFVSDEGYFIIAGRWDHCSISHILISTRMNSTLRLGVLWWLNAWNASDDRLWNPFDVHGRRKMESALLDLARRMLANRKKEPFPGDRGLLVRSLARSFIRSFAHGGGAFFACAVFNKWVFFSTFCSLIWKSISYARTWGCFVVPRSQNTLK